MTEKIIIAGSGGQGIMLLGKVIAETAMRENKFVTWLPAYGAEVRGGAAHCAVIISDKEIGSPLIDKADTLIAMNAPSIIKFQNRIKNKGLLILNSSLIHQFKKSKVNILECPCTEIAEGLGNIKVANMVALGAYLAKKTVIPTRAAQEAINEMAPADKKALVEINIKALQEGARSANG